MGCAESKPGPSRGKLDKLHALNIDDESVMKLACSPEMVESSESLLQFPFNCKAQLTKTMIEVAKETWELITKAKCEKYSHEDKSSEMNSTCLNWFTRKFVVRLGEIDSLAFDVYPSGMQKQSKTLETMVNFILQSVAVLPQVDGRVRLGPTLHADATKVEKMMYTMDEFTVARSHAWTALYSVLLTSVLPYSMSMEKLYSPEEDQIMATKNISHMYRTAGTLEALKTFKEMSTKKPDADSVRFMPGDYLSMRADEAEFDENCDEAEFDDGDYDADLERMEDDLPKNVSVTECFAVSSGIMGCGESLKE